MDATAKMRPRAKAMDHGSSLIASPGREVSFRFRPIVGCYGTTEEANTSVALVTPVGLVVTKNG